MNLSLSDQTKLFRAWLILSSGLARFKPPKLATRNMSEKGKEVKDQALKFEIGGKKVKFKGWRDPFKVIDKQIEANKVYFSPH